MHEPEIALPDDQVGVRIVQAVGDGVPHLELEPRIDFRAVRAQPKPQEARPEDQDREPNVSHGA